MKTLMLQTTNPRLLKRLGLLVLTPLMTGSFALAQDDEQEDRQVFELSPFVVSGEDDGYYATDTLAGTRIRTNVKDIGASIQILTEEFMDDVDADSVEELLLYTGSTEAAGMLGNFSGGIQSDGGTVDIEGVQNEPQRALRVRGLGSPDLTRDLFLTDIPMHRYNTDRVTVSRGANSILFGLGAPSGIVDNSLKKALLGKNAYRLNFRIGNTLTGEDLSLQGIADFNFVLKEDKVALRMALLEADNHFQQEPTYRRDSRQYFTLTAKPWESTTLRASYERGDIDANNPDVTGPLENVSRYIEAIDVVHTEKGDPTLPLVASPYHYAIRDQQPLVPEDSISYVFQGTDAQGWINTPNLTKTLTFVWDGSSDDVSYGFQPNMNSGITRSIKDGNFDTADGNNSRAAQMRSVENIGRTDRTLGWRYQGLTDLEYFDFAENYIANDNGGQNREYEAFNLTLEQLFLGGDLGFELAYDYQSYDRQSFNAFTGTRAPIRVDFNTHLGDGRENPNFGRPYILSTSQVLVRSRSTDRQALRATAFYKFDFNKTFGDESFLGRWFGRHQFTGNYTSSEREGFDTDGADGFFGTEEMDLDSVIANNPFRRSTSIISYIGPAVDLVSDPGSLKMSDFVIDLDSVYANSNSLAPGLIVPNVVYPDTRKSEARMREEPILREYYIQDGRLTRETIDSAAFVWQGFFLNGHVVPTVGWRTDTVKTWTHDADLYPNTPGYPQDQIDVFKSISANIEPQYFNLDGIEPEMIEGDRLSWGVVVHWPKFLLPLPKGTDLSFHYNDSDNFIPLTDRIDQYGDVLDHPAGDAKDFGFRVALWDGKFNIRVNWYEAAIINEQSNRVGNLFNKAVTQINGVIMDAIITDIRDKDPNDVDPDTGELVNPFYNDLLPALEQLHSFMGYSVDWQNGEIILDPNNPNSVIVPLAQSHLEFNTADPAHPLVGQVNGFNMPNINNLTDTQDVTSEGLEIGLTWNPTRNWRLHLNVTEMETVTSNSIPRIQAWTTEMVEKVLGTPNNPTALGGLDRSDPAGVVLNENFAGWYQGNILNTMNRIIAFDGLPNPEIRRWRVNFVTRYQFREGPLDGFSFGGSVRWQDRVSIGTDVIVAEDGEIAPDLDTLYFGPEQTSVDFFLGYRRKIWDGKVNWTIQFNIRNAFNDKDDLIPVVAQPDGSYAEVRVSPPRSYSISTGFRW
jgi:hypothetical protein